LFYNCLFLIIIRMIVVWLFVKCGWSVELD
jgi:hypothetical protein